MISLHRRFSLLERSLKSVILNALIYLRRSQVYIEVFLVSDATIKSLNTRFRGRRRVTNVLSFVSDKNFFAISPRSLQKYIGEIYLAPQYIDCHHEDITYLAVHGLLHLLGYAHTKKRDRIKMESLESKVLRHLR